LLVCPSDAAAAFQKKPHHLRQDGTVVQFGRTWCMVAPVNLTTRINGVLDHLLRPHELKKIHAHRVALDAMDALTLLVDHGDTLRAVEQPWPRISVHALREYSQYRQHQLAGR
jgi:hypothetical protein